jgi:hypothetical protein
MNACASYRVTGEPVPTVAAAQVTVTLPAALDAPDTVLGTDGTARGIAVPKDKVELLLPTLLVAYTVNL